MKQIETFSLILIALATTIFTGCGTRIILPQTVISEYEPTEFCNLPSHQNETVYIRGVYSGMEEYWQINPAYGQCDSLSVDLQFPEEIELQSKWLRMLQKTIEKYPTHCLIVDAVGNYDSGNENGYGHLGHNKSRFAVKRVINLQLVTKKQWKESKALSLK